MPPVRQVYNPFAIERPHATPHMLERQGSFRGFTQLNQASPFKRQLSLRINDLPSNLERTRSLSLEPSDLSRLPLSHIVPLKPGKFLTMTTIFGSRRTFIKLNFIFAFLDDSTFFCKHFQSSHFTKYTKLSVFVFLKCDVESVFIFVVS